MKSPVYEIYTQQLVGDVYESGSWCREGGVRVKDPSRPATLNNLKIIGGPSSKGRLWRDVIGGSSRKLKKFDAIGIH